MKKYKFFYLLLMCFFILGCYSPPSNQCLQSSKYELCKICSDSCRLIKKSISKSNTTTTISQDTIIERKWSKTNPDNDSVLDKNVIIYSRIAWLHLDTIFNHEIEVFSDKLPPIQRRKIPSYKKVQNKIKIDFNIYAPSNNYKSVKNFDKKIIVDGIIIKDLKTNKVENIRILIDSVEYILPPK